jgi:ribosome-associated toxin RatA of RatAB toxin-antitoxin module
MTEIKKTIEVPQSIEKMYALVTAVENYPDFISGCLDVQLHKKDQSKINCLVEAQKMGVNFAFPMVYVLHPPQMIEITLPTGGPFRQIKGFWRFAPNAGGGTQFTFELQYEVSNAFLGWTLTPLIKNEIGKLMKDFSDRAKA